MPESPSPAASSFSDASGSASRLGSAEARALLRECFAQYRKRLVEMARSSLDMATDLFEWNTQMPEAEVERFRARRGEWLQRLGRPDDGPYRARVAGPPRQGRPAEGRAPRPKGQKVAEFC